MSTVSATPVQHRNEITLVGRVSATPEATALPSGDHLVSLRLVVERVPRPDGDGRRAVVDTVTCVAWAAPARDQLSAVNQGDVVEVQGALRRRFWRAEGGARNRYEVEVTSATLRAGAGGSDGGGSAGLSDGPGGRSDHAVDGGE